MIDLPKGGERSSQPYSSIWNLLNKSSESEVDKIETQFTKAYHSVQRVDFIRIRHYDDELDVYLFILFDEHMQYENGMLAHKLTDPSDFSNMQKGVSTLEDVRKVDPGVYLTVWGSFHRHLDKSMTTVLYHEDGVVTGIENEEDPTRFVKLLLPEDSALISESSSFFPHDVDPRG